MAERCSIYKLDTYLCPQCSKGWEITMPANMIIIMNKSGIPSSIYCIPNTLRSYRVATLYICTFIYALFKYIAFNTFTCAQLK